MTIIIDCLHFHLTQVAANTSERCVGYCYCESFYEKIVEEKKYLNERKKNVSILIKKLSKVWTTQHNTTAHAITLVVSLLGV